MRIEGTHTLPDTIDHVFAGILDPELLQRIIPGCLRLIQLGPATPESGVTFEMRVGTENGPVTLTLRAITVRRPDHVQVHMWGRGPGGPFSGQISVDLVEQGTHTLGAYVLMVAEDQPAGSSAAARRDLAQDFISTICERLADELYTERARREAASAVDRVEQQVATPSLSAERQFHTPYGHIVTLPLAWKERREVSRRHHSPGIALWAQRALWMSAGALVGIFIIGIGIGLVRRFGDHEG
jgi:carbon monoxide dehydrogenase subunit G